MRGEVNFRKRIRLFLVISLIINVAFLTQFMGYITGYHDALEMLQAAWNHLENAMEYYLGICFDGPNIRLKGGILLGAFLIASITIYFVEKRL